MSEQLPYACWYENSRGDMLRLDEAPIVVQSSGLFDYQWHLTTFDRAARDGGKVVSARRAVQEKSLVLDVFADTQEEHNAALNRLHDVTEYDVCRLLPGKLWVNGQYIRCLAFASTKTLDRDWTCYTVVKLTLKVFSPAWTEERSVVVMPGESAGGGDNYKHYPGKYPQRYADDDAAYQFVNETNGTLPMVIKLFGPCVNPAVYVGGNEYALNTEIAAGDYAVIDQTDKSIWLVANNGTRTNLFHTRKKSVDNFLYAPTGHLSITCAGDFACEVIFLTQRSEPRWT